jgi:poly(A) polymerase
MADRKSLGGCEEALSPGQLRALKAVGRASETVGGRCYLVGGAVRDCLLGKATKDLDFVCTRPYAVAEKVADEVGERTGGRPSVAIFPKFGTAQVPYYLEDGEREDLEFVLPRRETYTYDSIKPEVEPGTFEEDALRRDFTLNALLLGVQGSEWMRVLDPTELGLEDLREGVLRTPLDPDTTFRDDPSRLFRLARFAACKGFYADPGTLAAARRRAGEINAKVRRGGDPRPRVPREAIRQMMDKGIVCDGYLETLDSTGVLEEAIPEVSPLKGLEQRGERPLCDVWGHTLEVVDTLPPTKELRWAGLFHDLGKATALEKEASFAGHELESERLARGIAERLKFSNDDTRRIAHLVRRHMDLISLVSQEEVTGRQLRRFSIENDGYESDLFELARADCKASGARGLKYEKRLSELEGGVRETQRELGMSSGAPFSLAVDGRDVMRVLAIPPSPRVGRELRDLRDAVIEGIVPNRRADMLEFLARGSDGG